MAVTWLLHPHDSLLLRVIISFLCVVDVNVTFCPRPWPYDHQPWGMGRSWQVTPQARPQGRAHPSAPTARPILAALRSTHGRGTPATPPPSGSVPRGLRPDVRRGLPRTMGPLGAGSETAPQRRDCSGERLEAGA